MSGNRQHPDGGLEDLREIMESASGRGPSYAPERRTGWGRTLFATAIGMVAVIGVGYGVAKVGFDASVATAFLPKIKAEEKVLDPGTGHVKTVDMKEVQPIRVGMMTVETATKVGFKEKVVTGLGNFDLGQQTLTRQDIYQVNLLLDPKHAEITWDPNVKDNKGMTIDVSDMALSTEVNIVPGKSKNTKESSSLSDLPSQITSDIIKAVAGQFGGDSSSAPGILGDVVKGNMSIENGMMQIGDIEGARQTAIVCTPEVEKQVDGFDEQLDQNVRHGIGGEILADQPTDSAETVIKGLPDLMKLPVAQLKDAINKATVILPPEKNGAVEITPDQRNEDAEKQLEKQTVFTKSASVGKCAVDSAVKQSIADDPNSVLNKTATPAPTSTGGSK